LKKKKLSESVEINLVDAKNRASDKDKPVLFFLFFLDQQHLLTPTLLKASL
jgi:hypothetical protein